MKSKLRSRFQWGGGKTKGAFPTSEPKNANIAPITVGKFILDDNLEIHTPIHSNTTVSTLSNNDEVFSKKRNNCGFDSDERSTMREQMWYKNQTYLREKASADVGAASNVASKYASDKRWNRYDNDDGSDYAPDGPDSPCGVSELDSFNHKLAKRSDSETTQQPSSLMGATDSTLIYDDDGTKSTFFYSEGGTEEDTTFEEVTLGTLDIDTSVSTRYEMADDESSKNYKVGFGTAPRTRQRSRNVLQQRSRSRSPPPPRRRSRSRNRNRSYSKDDASVDYVNSRCSFPISDELKGTVEDVSLAFNQIFHAFFISPDDVDKMSDKIRDACYDLKDLQDSYRFRSSQPSRSRR